MKKVYKTNIKNDLTTFKGMPNANVIVLGSTVVGDGGNAMYYWNDTSTDPGDGDNILEVTGVVIGRWIKLGGGVNPNSFIQNQNSIIQTANYRISDIGEAGGFKSSGSFNATAGLARANYFIPTLVATANNDTLVGIDINATFNTTPFTGVQRFDLRTANNVNLATTNGSFVYIGLTGSSNFLRLDGNTLFPAIIAHNSAASQRAQIMFNTTNGDIFCDYLASASGSFQVRGTLGSAANIQFKIFSNGNIVSQNAGTYVDGGERLQIMGTGRFAGGGETLKVGTNTGLSDFTYIGFYAKQATPTTRSGYIGYPTAGSNFLTISNEINNSALNLFTVGSGSVQVNAASLIITPNVATTQGWSIVSQSASNYARVVVSSNITINTSGSAFVVRSNRGGSPTLLGDILGSFQGMGQSASSSERLGATIRYVATENFLDTAYGTKMEFYTTSNTTITQSLRMTIDNDGKILSSFKSSSAAPTITDIPNGYSAMWKNTTSGEVRLYANDGGVLRSVLLS